MNEQLKYRVNSNVKNRYNNFIKNKYGHKQNRCGKSIEKLMKLELALEGDELYQNDPDVLALLNIVGGTLPNTHTQSKLGDDRVVEVIEEKVNEIIEDKFDTLNEKLEVIERKVKGRSTKKTGSLAAFKKQFQTEYGDCKQVSRRDITRFIMNSDGVYDSRTIQNRIEYLLAQEVIEPFAQNVYNLKF